MWPMVLGVGVLLGLLLPGGARAGQFSASLVVTQEYDDNIYVSEQEVEDHITRFTPSLAYTSLEEPRGRLLATFRPSIERYWQHSEEDEVNYNGSLEFYRQLTPRLSLEASDRLVYTPAHEATSQEVRARYHRGYRAYAHDRTNNFFDLGASWRPLRRTSLRASFSHDWESYEQDSQEYRWGVSLSQRVTARDTASLAYAYRRMIYEEDVDSKVHDVSCGWTRDLGRGWHTRASAGVSLVDEEDQQIDWSASLELSRTLPRWGATLSYHRSVSPGEAGEGTSLSQAVSLSGFRRFTRHLRASAAAWHSAEESVDGGSTSEATGLSGGLSWELGPRTRAGAHWSWLHDNGSAESYRLGVHLERDLLPRLRLRAAYAFYRQNALSPEEEDLRENVASLSLTFGPFGWGR